MATLEEADQQFDVDGTDQFPGEDPDPDQPAEALLGLSEEKLLKEQEHFEYQCYSGLDEAVHGWARAAPLLCIFGQQKKANQCKSKKTNSHWSTHTKHPEENCSATFTCDESHVELQQESCCSVTGAAGIAHKSI